MSSRIGLLGAVAPLVSSGQGRQHLRWWSTVFYRLGAAQVFEGTTLVVNDTAPCASRHPSPIKKMPGKAIAHARF